MKSSNNKKSLKLMDGAYDLFKKDEKMLKILQKEYDLDH